MTLLIFVLNLLLMVLVLAIVTYAIEYFLQPEPPVQRMIRLIMVLILVIWLCSALLGGGVWLVPLGPRGALR